MRHFSERYMCSAALPSPVVSVRTTRIIKLELASDKNNGAALRLTKTRIGGPRPTRNISRACAVGGLVINYSI